MKQIHLVIFGLVCAFSGYSVGSLRFKETIKSLEKLKTEEINTCWSQVDEFKSKCLISTEGANSAGQNLNETSSKNSANVGSNEVYSQSSSGVVSPALPQQSQATNQKDSRGWTKLGVKALEISFESDVKEFLKQVEVPDFFNELKSATTLSEDQAAQINGRFSGNINFESDDAASWLMEMEITGQIKNGELKGRQKIVLSKNGKVFSRSTGKGNLKDFQAFAGDPSAILINVYGDDGYVQLYYFPRLDMFSGLYYDKVSVGEFKKAGIVTLVKR